MHSELENAVDIPVDPTIISIVSELVKEGEVTDPTTPKGRLLAKAAKLFRSKGYERTTVRDLASAVGIQSGSIFHHFKSKEQILFCVMREVIVFTTARMKTMLEQTDNPKDALKVLVLCELEAINGMTGNAMSVLVEEWRSLSETSQRDILELRSVYEMLWEEVLQDAKSKDMHDIEPFVLRRLIAGAIAWTNAWYDPKKKMTLPELTENVVQLALGRGQ